MAPEASFGGPGDSSAIVLLDPTCGFLSCSKKRKEGRATDFDGGAGIYDPCEF